MEATGKAQPAEKDMLYHVAHRDLCITNIRPVSGLMVCTCKTQIKTSIPELPPSHERVRSG